MGGCSSKPKTTEFEGSPAAIPPNIPSQHLLLHTERLKKIPEIENKSPDSGTKCTSAVDNGTSFNSVSVQKVSKPTTELKDVVNTIHEKKKEAVDSLHSVSKNVEYTISDHVESLSVGETCSIQPVAGNGASKVISIGNSVSDIFYPCSPPPEYVQCENISSFSSKPSSNRRVRIDPSLNIVLNGSVKTEPGFNSVPDRIVKVAESFNLLPETCLKDESLKGVLPTQSFEETTKADTSVRESAMEEEDEPQVEEINWEKSNGDSLSQIPLSHNVPSSVSENVTGKTSEPDSEEIHVSGSVPEDSLEVHIADKSSSSSSEVEARNQTSTEPDMEEVVKTVTECNAANCGKLPITQTNEHDEEELHIGQRDITVSLHQSPDSVKEELHSNGELAMQETCNQPKAPELLSADISKDTYRENQDKINHCIEQSQSLTEETPMDETKGEGMDHLRLYISPSGTEESKSAENSVRNPENGEEIHEACQDNGPSFVSVQESDDEKNVPSEKPLHEDTFELAVGSVLDTCIDAICKLESRADDVSSIPSSAEGTLDEPKSVDTNQLTAEDADKAVNMKEDMVLEEVKQDIVVGSFTRESEDARQHEECVETSVDCPVDHQVLEDVTLPRSHEISQETDKATDPAETEGASGSHENHATDEDIEDKTIHGSECCGSDHTVLQSSDILASENELQSHLNPVSKEKSQTELISSECLVSHTENALKSDKDFVLEVKTDKENELQKTNNLDTEEFISKEESADSHEAVVTESGLELEEASQVASLAESELEESRLANTEDELLENTENLQIAEEKSQSDSESENVLEHASGGKSHLHSENLVSEEKSQTENILENKENLVSENNIQNASEQIIHPEEDTLKSHPGNGIVDNKMTNSVLSSIVSEDKHKQSPKEMKQTFLQEATLRGEPSELPVSDNIEEVMEKLASEFERQESLSGC